MANTQAAGEKGSSAILFQREGMPPIGEMLPCTLQHVPASFAGIITPAILIAATFDFTTPRPTQLPRSPSSRVASSPTSTSKRPTSSARTCPTPRATWPTATPRTS